VSVLTLKHHWLYDRAVFEGLVPTKSFLTRTTGDMRTALTLLRTSVEGLQDKDLLMTDCRGEPLDEVLQRDTEWTVAAQQLAASWARPTPPSGTSRTRRPPTSRSRRRAAEPACGRPTECCGLLERRVRGVRLPRTGVGFP
jgi:hypothetical protein